MYKRKLKKGELISSLDKLAECDWIIIHDRPYNKGWFRAWQLNVALRYISKSIVYEGVRLTNNEYYEGLTEKQLMQKFREEMRHYEGVLEMFDVLTADKKQNAVKAWKEEPVG
jgi:hypothetical protein